MEEDSRPFDCKFGATSINGVVESVRADDRLLSDNALRTLFSRHRPEKFSAAFTAVAVGGRHSSVAVSVFCRAPCRWLRFFVVRASFWPYQVQRSNIILLLSD